ncbi:HNH endonuclease signature motif containing protein [Mesorhizobium sp. STM 4661]|uniref:HNH endonuclease signature motif containing protein n=1 Tax=Mesorhizobium sp. STM 4661 TaxID=1297570 RepID=UPI0002BE19A7|nr:HNH endonuclease signature motif containing protein [Mesorhizobium sp. STM 4661]CCV12949.1 conserved hypothetical protein [Mesorhizobium sp. STM 4661]
MFSREQDWKTWNTKFAGKEAFTATNGHGYRRGSIFDVDYLTHRVIWIWMTGDEPVEIDHENHSRSDNRWDNLKDGTHTDNARNMSLPVTNTSGYIGVTFEKHRNSFRAMIRHEGRKTHIGRFLTAEQASAAYQAKALELGFHTNHGRTA